MTSAIDALLAQATAPTVSSGSSTIGTLMSLMQLGALGGRSGAGSRPGPGTPSLPPGSGLSQWIDQAEAAAGVTGGPRMDQMLNILISHESGGDPKIVNKTATPGGYHAAGLAQMIPPTFQSYNIPGLGGIFNPVANLAAAIRYMQDRYGSVANTPGIKSVMEGRGYEPY